MKNTILATILALILVGCNSGTPRVYDGSKPLTITIGDDYASVVKAINTESCNFTRGEGVDTLCCSYNGYYTKAILYFKYDKLVGYDSVPFFVKVKDSKE